MKWFTNNKTNILKISDSILNWVNKWIFSTNHKVISFLYFIKINYFFKLYFFKIKNIYLLLI